MLGTLRQRLAGRGLGYLLAVAAGPLVAAGSAMASGPMTPIETQYIAALGPSGAMSGTGAESWGHWSVDPGPRGVRLSDYEALKAAGGITQDNWTFDGKDWWLEEHGLLMEQPTFPLKPGRYEVTGDRAVTAILTIHPKDSAGVQRWELSDGASIYDVTHLRCRAARYTPKAGGGTCSPEGAMSANFPISPDGVMPAVDGCSKQDYQVLIVRGVDLDD